MGEPTYVLVHGAWGGSWCWRDLTAEFDRRGARWRTVDLASSRADAVATTSLSDDADVVVAACSTLGPVVLVGHSYGGAVITEAAPRVADLTALSYIAALVPDEGESATDASRAVRVRTKLDDAIELDGDYLRLNREKVGSALYGECGNEVREWAIAQLTRQTLASFRSARTSPSVTAPKLYISCLNDHAVDPVLQTVMAERCDDLFVMESDHSPFLSHPTQLANLLLA